MLVEALEDDLLVEAGPHLPEGAGADIRAVSMFSGLPSTLFRCGSQTCFGAMKTRPSAVVAKAELTCLRLKRRPRSPVRSIRSMSLTKGLNIGTLSVRIGASNEKITSSTVTGRPSWKVMPSRIVTSTVRSLTKVKLSAAQGRGSPSGPTRTSRSQTSSLTQLSGAPAM